MVPRFGRSTPYMPPEADETGRVWPPPPPPAPAANSFPNPRHQYHSTMHMHMPPPPLLPPRPNPSFYHNQPSPPLIPPNPSFYHNQYYPPPPPPPPPCYNSTGPVPSPSPSPSYYHNQPPSTSKITICPGVTFHGPSPDGVLPVVDRSLSWPFSEASFLPEDRIRIENYFKRATQFGKNEVFHVDDWDLGPIISCRGSSRCHPEFWGVRDAAKFAVENHNKFQGTTLEFRRVVKAYVASIRSGTLYFILLQTCDGSFYEAEVLSKFIHPRPSDDTSCEFTVYVFRPAIHYKG